MIQYKSIALPVVQSERRMQKKLEKVEISVGNLYEEEEIWIECWKIMRKKGNENFCQKKKKKTNNSVSKGVAGPGKWFVGQMKESGGRLMLGNRGYW